MSNEEFEKKMEFILEHQAQFAASIQEHNERFARNEELISRIGEQVGLIGEQIGLIGERMIQLEDLVNRLASATLTGFKDVNAKIDALVDSQIRLDDAQARTEANQALTDEALRKLIATVERHISKGRNGGQKQ
jgi:hypothetical protein